MTTRIKLSYTSNYTSLCVFGKYWCFTDESIAILVFVSVSDTVRRIPSAPTEGLLYDVLDFLPLKRFPLFSPNPSPEPTRFWVLSSVDLLRSLNFTKPKRLRNPNTTLTVLYTHPELIRYVSSIQSMRIVDPRNLPKTPSLYGSLNTQYF